MPQRLHRLGVRLRALVCGSRHDQDLRDEIAFHLAMREEQLRNAGTPHAGASAQRAFGSATRIREEMRDVWALAPRATTVLQDVRYAMRTLLRAPGFTAVVCVTLAFGIGVNTATFSIVNAALIRPLGFADPDRLTAVQVRVPRLGATIPFSPPDFIDFERDQQVFERVAAYANVAVEMSGQGEPVRLEATKTSASLFQTLGVAPLIGRGFTNDDDRPGADVAVLSWKLWQARFGGDRAVVGRTITLDRRPFTVVGVMPAAFEFPRRGPQYNNQPAELWLSVAFTDRQRLARGDEYNYSVVARLKPHVDERAVRAGLNVLGPRIAAQYPPVLRNAGTSIELTSTPLREAIAGSMERPLLLLLAAVGLVLLVTCANVANLVLSRAASRRREIAVRVALGSSRTRLLQLLLVEAVILSAAGGGLGVVLAHAALGAIPRVVAEALPSASDFAIDLRVLACTAGVAMATAVVFALLPLLALDRRTLVPTLHEETTRSTGGARRHRLQAGFVVSTVTIAAVLLVGAGLFIKSVTTLMATDPGFRSDRVVAASLLLPPSGYGSAASVRTFHRELLARATALPGVRSAALMTELPLERYERRMFSAQGVPSASDGARSTNLSWVHGRYFETLGIHVTRGRVFSDVEMTGRRRVVVVNQRLARLMWPGEDAVGKRMRWGLDSPDNPYRWLTVIGVIEDVADAPLGEPASVHAYEPFSQFPDFVLEMPIPFGRHVSVAVRADGDPRALVSSLRGAIRRLDAQLAIRSIEPMADRIRDVVAPRRFSALTLGLFAGGALLLAAVGLYGLLAMGVAERRREISIRLALGAEPREIRRMVVGRGLTLVGIGLAAGMVLALGAARAVASLLYQTESHDLVTFGTVPLVLMTTALVACARPAYRAARIDPIAGLRAD